VLKHIIDLKLIDLATLTPNQIQFIQIHILYPDKTAFKIHFFQCTPFFPSPIFELCCMREACIKMFHSSTGIKSNESRAGRNENVREPEATSPGASTPNGVGFIPAIVWDSNLAQTQTRGCVFCRGGVLYSQLLSRCHCQCLQTNALEMPEMG